MFSWICPKCGSEVPPSYNECPNCTATATAAPPQQASTPRRPAAPPPPPPQQARVGGPQQPAPPRQESSRPPKPAGVLFGPGGGDYDPSSAPPPSNYPPPPQQNYPPQGFAPQQNYTPQSPPAYPPQPPPPAYAPAQPTYGPPRSSGMPSWALMLLVALLVGGVVAGAVWLKRRSSQPADEMSHDTAPVATESAPTAEGAAHRYAKFVELSGFRISEDSKQRANIKMAVTNHSTADLGDLDMTVTLKTSDGRSLGTAAVSAKNLGPLSTAEVSGPLKTKLRAYELPDWQFVRAEFQITSQ